MKELRAIVVRGELNQENLEKEPAYTIRLYSSVQFNGTVEYLNAKNTCF